jgi:hypothetical protein
VLTSEFCKISATPAFDGTRRGDDRSQLILAEPSTPRKHAGRTTKSPAASRTR